MSLEAGDVQCTNGLSKRIFDARTTVFSAIGMNINPDQTALKADSYAIAKAVVDEIQANAKAVIPIGITAMQTSTAPGSPTGPSTTEFLLAVQ